TGMRAVIEPCRPESPRQTLVGHLQEITGVAVGWSAGKPVVVSASEDGTVRIWDLATQRERRILRHPAGVSAVACTPPSSGVSLCLSGATDGKGRLWRLDGQSSEPLLELQGRHGAGITCVAFSPDGKSCVTD